MIQLVMAFIVIIVAVALLLARVPIMIALGLPALVGALVAGGPGSWSSTVSVLGLRVMDAFNSFSFFALILWVTAGAIVVESGLMERWFFAVHVLAGRQVTPTRRRAWRDSFLGLPLTVVALLLVGGLRGMVDNHFLLLQMFLVIVVATLIAGGVSLFSAPKVSQMTMKQMKSRDGESWKTTAKATAEINAEGEAKRTSSKGSAALVLVLPGLFFVVFLVLLLGLPVGLDDLSGLVFLGSLVAALIDGALTGEFGRVMRAGWRAVRMVGCLGSTVSGAWMMSDFLEETRVLRLSLAQDGLTVILVLAGALVVALALGELIGPVAGAVLTVSVFSGFLAAPYGSEVSQQVASAILTSLLVGAACLGGIIARVLPPRDSPFPLSRTLVH